MMGMIVLVHTAHIGESERRNALITEVDGRGMGVLKAQVLA